MGLLRILFIEDNPDDEFLILREVKRGGYDVVSRRVETAEEMRHALHAESWDIIISDFSLPSFNAPGAVRLLKETHFDIPIIIVSGTVGEESAVASLKAGAHDFLSKNKLDRLLPAIERELREARGRDERRKEQVRLRASEEALAAVFSASPLSIVTTDSHGFITGWNNAAESVFGFTAEEAVGRHIEFVSGESDGTWYDEVLMGKTISRREVGGVRKNGDRITLLVFASALRDADSRAAGSVCIFGDITEQRALEEQLRQAQKMEAIGRLAGGIAHDFNNILTAIRGYATLLQREMPVGSHCRADVDGILDAAARAATFTRQLLAFSRNQVTQPETLDINELVSGMLNMLSHVIGGMHNLEFDTSPELRHIFADRGQVGQVVMNLVVNARDAMPDGGSILLQTERVEEKPEGRIRADGNELPGPYSVLHVCDSGTGISPEVVGRIFEPFFTTKDAMQGTGLGLSTVYGIVTQHGGFLCVDTSSAGTKFSVYLPEGSAIPMIENEAPPVSQHSADAVTTIVLVEDDPGIRDLLIRAMSGCGMHVLTADNADAALDILRDNPATSILVTDLMLPGMSGADLISRVRASHPQVRTILISGYSAGNLQLSPDVVFIEKPFALHDLMAAVQRLLPDRQLRHPT